MCRVGLWSCEVDVRGVELIDVRQFDHLYAHIWAILSGGLYTDVVWVRG